MTIIAEFGDWWIESHNIARVNIAGGAGASTVNLVLDRGGHFAGVTAVIDGVANNAFAFVRHRDDSEILYGDVIDNSAPNGLETSIVNNDGVARDLGLHVILFMKR